MKPDTTQAGGGATEHYLAVIGQDGWRSPDDPPEFDRIVQIAWDDFSTSDKCIGCFDSEQNSTVRIWWAMWPSVHKLPRANIGAWRNRIKP